MPHGALRTSAILEPDAIGFGCTFEKSLVPLRQVEAEKQEAAKSGRFIANRTIERGNEVKAFKL
ncbi:hypothetical protein [Rhizobium lentis]|uniref:Uncharacterized protein n=1 Tax=Rhizobium lentis TaxID=1138194 RepID=A0A7W8UK42_9HYPH|nr:hypothetical protein [Rhizobium lentis]MBB4571922.1 hypothetical protein [Rhizobium lentis]MBB5548887.1 hypothetical protein [Rhizobium lentis]MBB5559420.1 hypothetical protein [Rhizobium lentis]MBB5565058.1 hypothetical protein [Rhizobium lentis]